MKYLATFLLLVLSGAAQAESLLNNLRYGVTLLSQDLAFEVASDTAVASASESNSGIAIFAEKFYNHKYRFSGSLGLVSHTGSKILNATLSADYLYPIDGRTALYGGLAIGGAGQQYNGSSLSDMSMGLVFGGQLGALFFINNNISLDLAYRIRSTSLEAEVAGSPLLITTTGLDEIALGLVISF